MKYLIGLLIALGLIIFIIVKFVFGGGTPPPPPLSSYYDTGTEVRMIIKNPTQASSKHEEIQITVGRRLATLTIFRGYQYSIIKTKSFLMNDASYRDFLRGLQISGQFMKGDTKAKYRDDSGYCALGLHYVYEIVDPVGNVTQKLWSTSCGVKTFGGDADTVQQLFKLQIPNYDNLTEDVDLTTY